MHPDNLSEHSGDASPGAKAFVRVANVRANHAELSGKDYRYMVTAWLPLLPSGEKVARRVG
ncbi:hypothetical protein HFO94_33305 [Rhizobium leguminosarum]|uniref:Uncharacterized protein n=1 Tax=Rhizobium laguerreae TaxID=1076926 RepID=A0A7Y2RBU1_9HYPH|nr:hypothetical protein [Rhizobium leguminosarum]NNH46467.1 hypothetical protein [Rhizobium laguerreae]NNH67972.1 hypothetical protein [Rhizobium laguerreae]